VLFRSDKGEVHIPGAGTFGMFVLLVSLGMLFAGTMAVYLVFRTQVPVELWRPVGLHHLPWTLWLSTGLLLACSAKIHWALYSIRRDRQFPLLLALTATLTLGVGFLLLQSWNWYEMWQAISADQHHSKFLATFYLLTGLHAAHVLGGLISLALVLQKARRHIYSRNFHPGVRYCTIYWHFLDAAWLVIFLTLLLGS